MHMRKFLISELDPQAAELARRYGLGVETTAFCAPENMEDDGEVARKAAALAGFPVRSLHAPYYELTPCAIDPLIGRVSRRRYLQAAETCVQIGARRMVVHSGFQAQTYYPQWFVPKSIEFWRRFLDLLPEGVEIALENVFDPAPDLLGEIVDGVGDARFRACLDLGHAFAYSAVPPEAWIDALGARISHVHLHNNAGECDVHAPLDCGGMDMQALLERLETVAPEALLVIESTDAQACLRYLLERGYINDQSV